MKTEVYNVEEIDYIINQIEVIQDMLITDEKDEIWEMLENIIDILMGIMMIKPLNKYYVEIDKFFGYLEFSGNNKELEEFIRSDKEHGEFSFERFMNMVRREGFILRLVD